MNCYCGKNKDFSQCCQLYLSNEVVPSTAEDLMRSRYSAFCTKNIDYVIATTDLQVRFEFDRAGNEAWAEKAQFEKLEVVTSEESGNKGIVEFKAYFKLGEENHIHHEVSTFRKTNGQWFFRAGRVVAQKQ